MHLLMPPTSSPDGVIDNSQVRRDRIGDRDYPRLHFASWDKLGGGARQKHELQILYHDIARSLAGMVPSGRDTKEQT